MLKLEAFLVCSKGQKLFRTFLFGIKKTLAWVTGSNALLLPRI
jgi:hypothetical protein